MLSNIEYVRIVYIIKHYFQKCDFSHKDKDLIFFIKNLISLYGLYEDQKIIHL